MPHILYMENHNQLSFQFYTHQTQAQDYPDMNLLHNILHLSIQIRSHIQHMRKIHQYNLNILHNSQNNILFESQNNHYHNFAHMIHFKVVEIHLELCTRCINQRFLRISSIQDYMQTSQQDLQFLYLQDLDLRSLCHQETQL